MKNRYGSFDMAMGADIEEYQQVWVADMVEAGVDEDQAWEEVLDMEDGDLRTWWHQREL